MFRPPTDDVRIEGLRPLIPPAILMEEIHPGDEAIGRITDARRQISDIVHGKDDRLVVVVGPCSIHDPAAALDYGLITPGLQIIMLGMGLTLELTDFSRVFRAPAPILWGVALQ